ncbi:MAG: hypothetical protein EP329_02235 [Deltaproteobacteria bacterium]|nr:MAG: hypothetical protein EP329_02235 [Deltaproteobacteria bacterium]
MNSPRSARALVVLALLALVAGGCGKKHALTGDAAKVDASFEAYRSALLDKDGKRVADLVGPATLAYYEELLDLARYGGREDFAARNMVDQIAALEMRRSYTREQLAETTAYRALAHLTTANDEEVNPMMRLLEIEQVTVTGDLADAELTLGGKTGPTPLRLQFARVDGAWKVELPGWFELTNELLISQIEKEADTKLDPELIELVVRGVMAGEDEPPAPVTIFDPPLTRSAPLAEGRPEPLPEGRPVPVPDAPR